jgi:type VI secretion system secreted protein VgrG
MRPVLSYVCMFLLAIPGSALAGANPVVDALAAGTVVQFSGKEAVSQAYEFDVTVATTDKNLNMTLAVGQPIALLGAPGRQIVGMIERIEQLDGAGAQGLYRLRIVSSMNRLKYRSTSRTFYGKKLNDIVAQVLTEAGISMSNVEFRVTTSPVIDEMTVQYQETDFAFVSRLMEGAGIHYHVEATPAGDRLVFSDTNGGFPIAPVGKVGFAVNGTSTVSSFTRGVSIHSGQVQAGDYNWRSPGLDLSATAQTVAFADLTERMFPAGVEEKVESQAAANLRLAARIAEGQQCSGESTFAQLQAGQRLFLSGHPRADFNQEYVITAVEHHRTGKEYRNTFRCLPSQIVFRPQPLTPVPTVAGVVPGIVTGPSGETRHVDQFGRVKVRFPWRSPTHANSPEAGDAGFVRVAQIAAGAGTAAMWLPDIGDEVLVAFEHGDLRRPVVIGSVYNGKDMPPVALPANKHLSILRQQGTTVRTEMIFDGTPGNQRLLFQSGQNSLTMINAAPNQASSVAISSGGDLTQRAARAFTLNAASDVSVTSGQTISVTSQKDAVITVAGNTNFTTGAALKATVGADAFWTVGATAVLESGKDLNIRAGQNVLLQSAKMARFMAGEDAVLQTGRSFITNSGAMFQFVAAETGAFKVGDSSFLSKKDGTINIQGRDIAIMASGTTAVKSGGDLILKGSKITQN